ncbi:hypothetical protein E3N88_08384 [Mikania micrantha]|uniref:Bulb-type lectin domain-containing protein n=1 Tax=Mikania micrantha TaxID=192012 RepID=A0A5N6L7S2_9ASTR|nr:hypothetical protein E3N88_46163 [Mikania micrantha]KAD6453678.1 hypothetical protein E3N88_08384 [Mikania micrantha]
MIALIIFIILTANHFPVTGVSTLKSGDQLNLTSHLISPGSNFTLGFFTIPETNNTYLGIWYTNNEQFKKVWVANPSTPIISSSAIVVIDQNTGKLIIATGESTHLNLKNESDDQILWQSFDHPINVLLPGMKLGSNLKTGRNWILTSWLSDEIPDSGAFTLSWEPNGEDYQRILVRQRDRPYWTSGNLKNQNFEFMNVNNLLLFRYDLDYVYTDEERYFSYNSINYVNPMWILRPHGRIVDGNDRVISSSDLCYGYDSGNGCVASSRTPHCRSESDKFSLMNGDFASDTTRRSVDDNSSLSIGDCMMNCWNDCGCLGFITGGNGSGCIRWLGTKSILLYSIVHSCDAPPLTAVVLHRHGAWQNSPPRLPQILSKHVKSFTDKIRQKRNMNLNTMTHLT